MTSIQKFFWPTLTFDQPNHNQLMGKLTNLQWECLDTFQLLSCKYFIIFEYFAMSLLLNKIYIVYIIINCLMLLSYSTVLLQLSHGKSTYIPA